MAIEFTQISGSKSSTAESSIVRLDSIGNHLVQLVMGNSNELAIIPTTEEQTFFSDFMTRLNSGEKLSGFISIASGLEIFYQFSSTDYNSISFYTLILTSNGDKFYCTIYYTNGTLTLNKIDLSTSEIITTNYTEGNDYLTTDSVLSEGLYKLNLNIGTYYSFASFLDISNASIAYSTTSFGKLGSNSNLIMVYTYENTNDIGSIKANILMLTGSTTQAMRLSELWEFFKNNVNVYPTITLTKIH